MMVEWYALLLRNVSVGKRNENYRVYALFADAHSYLLNFTFNMRCARSKQVKIEGLYREWGYN